MTYDDCLARLKRASLREQTLRAAWQLGALVRRAEREAPEFWGQLHYTVQVLLVLGERLAQPDEEGVRSPEPSTPAAGGPRQGELF